MCLVLIVVEQMEASMSNPNEPYHNKGVGLAFLIIAFTMVALPVIIGTSMGWFNLLGILGL